MVDVIYIYFHLINNCSGKLKDLFTNRPIQEKTYVCVIRNLFRKLEYFHNPELVFVLINYPKALTVIERYYKRFLFLINN